MIPLRVHNVLDYVIAAVLVVCPFVFGFSDVEAARNIFLVLGFGLAAYSLITNYRYSLAKIIPLGLHMAFDVTAGIILMLAPAIFGYRNLIGGGVYGLHFVLGFGAIGLVALTRPKSDSDIDRMDTTHDVDTIDDFRRAA